MKIYGNLYLPETIFEFNLILAGSRTPLFEQNQENVGLDHDRSGEEITTEAVNIKDSNNDIMSDSFEESTKSHSCGLMTTPPVTDEG